jgi:hypothetical protein
VGEAGDGVLRLPPLQDGQAPRRPLFDLRQASVVLVAEAEQHEVPGVAGRKARDLEVVVQQGVAGGQWVVGAGEELLLVVIAGAPREHGADAERFSDTCASISLGPTPFSGLS